MSTATRISVWLVAVLVTLLVAWRSAIGPVLFEFDELHGVHLGDVVVAAACGALAWLVTRDRGSDVAGNPR